MENLKKTLEAAGCRMSDLVAATRYLTDVGEQDDLNRVWAEYLEGHLPEASTHLQESVRLLPDQLAPYYYLALVARDQGKDAEAISMLQDLLHRYPDHASSCEVLGSLLMSAQRYPEAEISLERAVQLNPKSVKANYQLGLLLSRMGKKDEADKRLEVAKSLRQEDESNSRLQLRLLDPDQ